MSDSSAARPAASVPPFVADRCGATFGPIRCGLSHDHAGSHEGSIASSIGDVFMTAKWQRSEAWREVSWHALQATRQVRAG